MSSGSDRPVRSRFVPFSPRAYVPVDSRYIVGSRTAVSRNTALVAGRAVEAAALGSAMGPATGALIEPLLSNVDRLTDPASRLLRARFASILSSPVDPS